MLSEKMMKLGKKRSVIRELFEYGNRRKAEIGAENVFDFSLGNPSVNPPACVKETIKRLLETEDDIALHGYTSAQGDAKVREAVADYINRSFGRHLTGGHIYMTVGAAASLTISLKAMAVEGDEFITFSPFFPEYRVFVENAGGTLKVVPCNTEDFQIDRELFGQAITPGTKAVILNSPNNPSGVVLSEETVKGICEVMEKKQAEYGHAIYLITDEPYRELVYDDNIQVPYLMNYYKNTLVCYSFSKSLSLPGERIGYIAVCEEMEEWEDMYAAICGAGRSMGYVCAPSLFQRVAAECCALTSDLSVYARNAKLLVSSLREMGYTCVEPQGAFYLFLKTLEPDDGAFSQRAKGFDLLLVPGSGFGAPGWVRLAFCVQTEMIERALPKFKELAESYQ